MSETEMVGESECQMIYKTVVERYKFQFEHQYKTKETFWRTFDFSKE